MHLYICTWPRGCLHISCRIQGLLVVESVLEAMAVWSCSILFLCILVSSQLVHGSADAIFEPDKCHCSPVPDIGSPPIDGSYSPPDDGISPPSTPESPPSYSPPDGGISTPSTPESPPEDGGNSPPISNPPSPYTSSTPPLTPPYYTTTPPSAPSTSYDPTPSPPQGGGNSPSPTTPSIPAYGSSSPPTSPTPSYGTPTSPTTPSTPDYTPPADNGGAPLPSPATPDYGTPTVASPPLDISVPSSPDGAGSVPSVPDLSPPVVGDPGSSTGTCDFWGTHPEYFPSILSFFSSISDLFGSGSSPSIFGGDMTLQEALTNKRRDGYGSLLREGSASLLNSFVNEKFVFSPQEVKQKFNAALTSNHAAAVQATKFKSANEGHLRP